MRELCLTLLVSLGLAGPVAVNTAEAKSTRLWLAEISALAAGIECDGLDLPPPLPPEPKPKVPRRDCPLCKGTGKVKSGDGIAWVTCDNCYAEASPAALPPYRECPGGVCPSPQVQQQNQQFSQPPRRRWR